jgi:hypothetical protein
MARAHVPRAAGNPYGDTLFLFVTIQFVRNLKLEVAHSGGKPVAGSTTAESGRMESCGAEKTIGYTQGW